MFDRSNIPAVRWHHLKAFGKSPAHYLEAIKDADDETSSMERGSAVHAILLKNKRVTFYPGPTRRGKEWEAFQASNTNSLIVTATEYETANRMADQVRGNHEAMALLTGTKERTLLYKLMGLGCRATPDVYSTEWVTELKTTNSSAPNRFPWQAIKYGYHGQLAWYWDALLQSGSGIPKAAYVVAVESAPPFPVTVFRLTDRALDKGRRMARLWLEGLISSIQSDQWPGYSQAVCDLDVPDDDVELIFGDSEAAP